MIIKNRIFFPNILFPTNFFLNRKNKNIYSEISNQLIFYKNIYYNNFFLYSFINIVWQQNYYNKHKLKLFNIELKKENKENINFFINKKMHLLEDNIQNYNKNYDIRYNKKNLKLNPNNNYLYNSISYTYIYNQTINKNKKNPLFFSLDIESSYNLFFLLKKKIISQYKNFKYYQYYKINLDFKKYYFFNKKLSLFHKIFIGLCIPYGNSKSIPIEKSYYCGGENDIRAWYMYSLGPGSSKKRMYIIPYSNIKILTSIELKYKIIKDIFFVSFLDAGNIWDSNYKDNNNYKSFYLNKFYKQIALGGGIGVFYDLTPLILRLNISYKIIDPAKMLKNYWNINNLDNPMINFTIGKSF